MDTEGWIVTIVASYVPTEEGLTVLSRALDEAQLRHLPLVVVNVVLRVHSLT